LGRWRGTRGKKTDGFTLLPPFPPKDSIFDILLLCHLLFSLRGGGGGGVGSVRIHPLRLFGSNTLLLESWNADWCYPRIMHIERGCCGSPEEEKRKMFSALCRSNVLLGGHGRLPSKHRIGSTAAANACPLWRDPPPQKKKNK
jgi:hypothetical protein